MKHATIVIIFLVLGLGGCDEYFTEKVPNPTPITSLSPIHTKLPEGWKIQRNGKNKYRLIKPDGKIFAYWGDYGGNTYGNMQNAINSAWKYIQFQIDTELESKWHDVESK